MKTTDLNLQKNVAEELSFDPTVEASLIGVGMKDGVATLTGRVPNYAQKIAAEDAARRVAGVKGLACEIEVELPEFHQHSDADIVAAALKVIGWDVSVPKDAVVVEADKGWVTLDGATDWQFQKERAELDVRYLSGVRGVTSRITVKPHPAATDVEDKLRQVFERRAGLDAQRMSVETRDSVVTLRGTVHSWVEHQDATRAAFSVPGVKRVENLTTIS